MAIIPKPRYEEHKSIEFNLENTLCLSMGKYENLKSIFQVQLKQYIVTEVISVENQTCNKLFITYRDDIVKEGYELYLHENGDIEIVTSSEEGAYYGLQTFIQYIQSHKAYKVSVFKDHPLHEYRGFHLDVSRHFVPVDEVKRLIDTASRFKMNHFHWHLTDDHGWRIEIKSFPSLTYDLSKSKKSYSKHGFYTQKEIIEIVSYAKERMIEIIPEIDMPGHILAVLVAYPKLACEPKNFKYAIGAGIQEDVLCIGNVETIPFMKTILDEIMTIFPNDKIHLGGDEVPVSRWLNCEKCKRLAEEKGLSYAQDLQTYFLQEMIDYINKKGRTAVLWNDSVIDSNLQGDIICQYWMSSKKLESFKTHLENNYMIIDSNFKNYYLDYPIEVVPLNKTYNYESLFDKKYEHNGLKGLECAIWTEHIYNREVLNRRVFPRLFAVAESAWSHEKSLASFEKRLNELKDFTDGLNCDVPEHKTWRTQGLRKLVHSVLFYKKMINIKTLLLVIKMKKQQKVLINNKHYSMEVSNGKD